MKTYTITIAQAIAWLEALQRTAADRIPVKFAFLISRNIAALGSQPDVAAAAPLRVELIRKYGTDDGKGNISVAPEKFRHFAEEWEPIAAKQIGLDLAPLPVELQECDKLTMTPADALILTGLWAEPAKE